MNLRPGIDTPQPNHLLLIKCNLPFNDKTTAIKLLTALQNANLSHPKSSLNLLVGFGLRFFLGPLDKRSPEEPIPNFPPGGVFKPRQPTRFGITQPIPLYLRTMNAAGDKDWIAKKLNLKTNDNIVTEKYQAWLSQHESDLIVIIEGKNKRTINKQWRLIEKEVIATFQLNIVSKHIGENKKNGRLHMGWQDGTSNLQDLIEKDIQYYRSKIYLPHPAPAYPGEPIWARDKPLYDGGTYLVHRKYIEHLDKWHHPNLSYKDVRGCIHKGRAAQNRIIGRDYKTGKVISRINNTLLNTEYDSTETNLAPMHSHILKARGGSPAAPFIGPFPPLKPGETNAFQIQDIRIRRRGFSFKEQNTEANKTQYGLHFICFQNNIQQTGFEFINNIWLLNPCFRGHIDQLFDVDAGIIEPIEGSYYFIPPEQYDFPGDVFFIEEDVL